MVGGFNPFEKYARQIGFIFPNFRGEHKKYLKPPTSNGKVKDPLLTCGPKGLPVKMVR